MAYVKLGSEISVILVIPPTETVCSVAETTMAINVARRDLLLVPLQAWEILQLSTYYRYLDFYDKLKLKIKQSINDGLYY